MTIRAGFLFVDMEGVKTKICSTCKRDLPLTQMYFRRTKKSKDGFHAKCKECDGRSFQVRYRVVKDGLLRCSKCKKLLLANDFYFHRNNASSTGFNWSCKECDGYNYKKSRVFRLNINEENKKFCSKCGEYKPANTNFFYKAKDRRSGLSSLCKSCSASYAKSRQPIRNKKAAELRLLDNDATYKRRTYQREYLRNKRSTDIYFKIVSRISAAIRRSILKSRGNHSIEELIGCDIPFYREYIESLFVGGMSWDMFNSGEIHIDHIKPLSSFDDLTDEKQLKECFNYKNTQPLFAVDNVRKGNQYNGKRYYYKKH